MKTPQTPEEWTIHRIQLSCQIGRDAIDGSAKPPAGCTRLEWAIYNMLHAIEELAKLNKPPRSGGPQA